MADLQVNEKGAGNRSLDHPTFGDVYETTYKRGVISDIKKTADDPIAVLPLVKVKIDGSESDFIPIFFRPKEQYWDGPSAQATDFDSDSKAYKQAWMSFRGDDEVVVMLRKGQPFAVVAFADRVPRIGENIVKLNLDKVKAYVNCNKQEPYADEENGPDGKNLKLKTKYEVIYQDHQEEKGPDPNPGDPFADCPQRYYSVANVTATPDTFQDPPPGYDEGSGCMGIPPIPTVGQQLMGLTQVGSVLSKIFLKTYYIHQVLAVVGPILYCFQFYSYAMNSKDFYATWTDTVPGVCLYVVSPPTGAWPACTPITPKSDNQSECAALLAAAVASAEANNGIPYRDDTSWWASHEDQKYKIIAMVVSAGVYTKELYNSIKNSPRAPHRPDHHDGGWDVNNVPDGHGGFFSYRPGGDCTENNFYQKYDGMTVQEAMTYNPSSGKYFMSDKLSGTPIKMSEIVNLVVRPHTKEELQAAGMWPDAD